MPLASPTKYQFWNGAGVGPGLCHMWDGAGHSPWLSLLSSLKNLTTSLFSRPVPLWLGWGRWGSQGTVGRALMAPNERVLSTAVCPYCP